MRVEHKTDIGLRRQGNEDSYLVDLKYGIFILADGMGGFSYGAEASKVAVEKTYEKALSPKLEPVSWDAQGAVRELAKRYDIEVGTTLTYARIVVNYLAIEHTGDTRVYLMRDRQLEQITEDHTALQKALAAGKLPLSMIELAREQLGRMLTRHLGMPDYPGPDLYVIEIQSGDRLLMSTDGLHDYFTGDELESDLAMGCDLDHLFNKALERGGRDNLTAIMIDL